MHSSSGCTYFDTHQCRSCDLLALPYEEQLALKQAKLTQTLGSIFTGPINKIIASDKTFASRNKAKLAVAGSAQNPILGFPRSDGSIVEITQCPLHLPQLNIIALRAKELIRTHGISPYDIASRQGELKYLLLRVSETTGEIMLRFVARSNSSLPLFRKAAELLQSHFPALKVCSVNIQPEPKAIIEGPEEILLTSQRSIKDKLGELTLLFSPQAFSQVTSNVAAKLYQYSSEIIEKSAPELLYDLYCGVGAFGLFAAKGATKVIGVESSTRAIIDATDAAALNKISNCTFHAADAQDFYLSASETPNALIVNPPRRGLSEALVSHIIVHKTPQLILYSSCNPESLARDLKRLVTRYTIEQVQPFDMFPLTSHLESLVVLRLKN